MNQRVITITLIVIAVLLAIVVLAGLGEREQQRQQDYETSVRNLEDAEKQLHDDMYESLLDSAR